MNLFKLLGTILLFLFYSQPNEKISILSKLKDNIRNEKLEANLILFEHAKLDRFDCVEKGRIYHQMGLTYYNLAEEEKGIEFFKKAIGVWQKCNGIPQEEVANTIYNIGVSYQYTQNIYLGKHYIDTALYLYERIDTFPIEKIITKYEGAASFYADLKDFSRAELLNKNAENKYKKIQSKDAIFPMINRLLLYIDFKKYNKGLILFNEIDSLLKKDNTLLDDYYKSIFYLNSAHLFLKLDNLDKSNNYAIKAKFLLPKEEHNLLSNFHEIVGTYYARKNNLQAATLEFEKALNYRMKESSVLQQHLATAYAYENLSGILLKKGENNKALEYINKAIKNLSTNQSFDADQNPLINDQNHPIDLIRQLIIKDQIFYQMDSSKIGLLKCIKIHEKVDSLIDQSINQYSTENTRLELRQIIEKHTELAITRNFRLSKLNNDEKLLERAFYFSSKAKSQIMAQGMNDQLVINELGSAETINNFRKLQNDLNQIEEQILESKLKKDSLLDKQSRIKTELEILRTTFLKRIGREKTNSFQYSIKSPDEIKAALENHQLVIDFFIGKKHSYVFYINKDIFESRIIKNDSLDQMLLEYREKISSPSNQDWKELSKNLYQILFSDELEKAKRRGIKNLILLPEGSLNYIPMETFVSEEERYLIKDFNLSYLYSTAFLQYSKNRNFDYDFVGFATKYSKNIDQKLFDLGYINNDEKYGQLSMSEKELLACKVIYSEKYLLGKEASVDNFFKYAAKSKILYLSLHGLVDEEESKRTSLLFDDENTNFILNSFELYKIKLETDLVILSACHSASGKLYQSEGIIGMTRAFATSGANNVVSSLWPATEKSASLILPKFLAYLQKGESKSEALRNSKINYLEEVSPGFQHPYYWSNFILLGVLESNNQQAFLSIPFIIFASVLLSMLLFFIFQLIKNKKDYPDL